MLKKVSIFLVSLLLLTFAFVPNVLGNSAEPPKLMIIVTNPPDDLKLYYEATQNGEPSSPRFSKTKQGFETYYTIMGSKLFNMEYENIILVEYGGNTYRCELPDYTATGYNDLYTLNLKTNKITLGQNPFRLPILVSLRVGLTLIIEGFVLFLFGYRKKESIKLFLIVNLITQGILNILISGPHYNGYFIIGFFFLEIIIFIIEMIVFGIFLKEKSHLRGAIYAFLANLASLVIGGYIITVLPV